MGGLEKSTKEDTNRRGDPSPVDMRRTLEITRKKVASLVGSRDGYVESRTTYHEGRK